MVFEFDNAQVELNLNDATYPIEILEYSDGLSEWIPVSKKLWKRMGVSFSLFLYD